MSVVIHSRVACTSTRVPCTSTRVPCTSTRVPCTSTRVPCASNRVPCLILASVQAPHPAHVYASLPLPASRFRSHPSRLKALARRAAAPEPSRGQRNPKAD
ncbi:hypothetical protein B0H17DRAFT_460721 [Mycena rosella]|uniref:Uncharacterized protein n=1 Tax=Mycena rosella TaxID=1033263 RepID=A0AAD7GLD3_MYCRO|nr:hypothetical protein B0H17DRAFT_460721 [Mycena rosella]